MIIDSIVNLIQRTMNYLRSFFSSTPARHRIYAQIRYSSEIQPILSMTAVKNVPLILNFSAPWCNTCHEENPKILDALEETLGRLDYAEVKADEPEMSEFLMRFGIKTFPTLVAIRRELRSADLQIRSNMRQYIDKAITCDD